MVILRFLARLVIWRRHPLIIVILGDGQNNLVKEAVHLILASVYFVRQTEKRRTDETNILLTILGASSVNPLTLFGRWLALMLLPVRYPEVLILEADLNAERLLARLPIKIAVIAGNIAKEQEQIVPLLSEDSLAIIAADHKHALKLREKITAKTITYGFSEDATLRADNLASRPEEAGAGFSFKLNYEGKTIPVRFPKAVTEEQIKPVLAAVAAGMALKMNLVEIVSILEG